jgi:hypothetical protein
MPLYRIEWLDEAAADVRALDRPTAFGVRHRSDAYRSVEFPFALASIRLIVTAFEPLDARPAAGARDANRS